MPEWLKSPVVGAILGGILVFVLTYFLYYRPALAKLDEQNSQKQAELSQKQAEVNASEDRLKQAEKQRNDLLKELNNLKSQWQSAKRTFLLPLTMAIREANKSEKEWEGKPRPTQRQFAEQIVKERDALRDRIRQMKVDLDTVYDALNSDIDAIRDALGRQPPANEAELRRLIGRLNPNQWADKQRLIEDLVQKTFFELGCPRVMATNP